MTVYIAGDTHGRESLDKLMSMNFDYSGITSDDYLIICGDFGLVWYAADCERDIAYKYEKTLDWLDSKPWTVLFVDGNHENHDRLATYPVETWHGGKVHKIRNKVMHLMRGEMFEIEGKLYFCMGGAASIDKECRKEGSSWWASEIPSDDERAHAIDTLDAYGWTCDYVITHDCPANVKFELGCRTGINYKPDAWGEWLQMIADKLTFTQWFFGHYHVDYLHIGIGGKYTVLFDYIYDVDADYWADRMAHQRINSYEQIPASKHRLGYTIKEIADIANVTVEEAEEAMGITMRGSTVAMNDDGEILVYKGDIFRVLDWC